MGADSLLRLCKFSVSTVSKSFYSTHNHLKSKGEKKALFWMEKKSPTLACNMLHNFFVALHASCMFQQNCSDTAGFISSPKSL